MSNEMTAVQIFNNEEFGEIRTVIINDEPWFVGKDVATALGYSDTVNALKKHVDSEDKIMGCQNATPSVTDSLGRVQYPTWINESGVYSLIFGSKLDNAKRFKHWVTFEVLPSLECTAVGTEINHGVQIFNNDEFGSVRTIQEDDKILFCGSDIAKALGYSRPNDAITAHCKSTVKRSIPHPQSMDKMISMSFITEGDVYRLVVHSKLPSAEKFERWVFDEVLPSLRKDGYYKMKKLSPEQMMRIQLDMIDKSVKRIEVLENNVESVNDRIDEMQKQINVIGAYHNSKQYASFRAVCANRVRELLTNEIYKSLWSSYFYKAIHSNIAKQFNVSSTKLIPVDKLAQAKEMASTWIPYDGYIYTKTHEMIAMKEAGTLKEAKAMALTYWLMETDNGNKNPFYR